MKILVCGGRIFGLSDEERNLIHAQLADLVVQHDDSIVVGGAPGVDTVAEEWAKHWEIRYEVFPAQWRLHGKKAGPIRNQRMLDEARPDLVVAFPGGAGTADMVRRAHKAGINVIQVRS